MERKTKAVILSIIPGLGHIYLGFIWRGIIWFALGIVGAVTVFGLFLVWPVCMIDAYQKGRHTLMAGDLEAISKAINAKK